MEPTNDWKEAIQANSKAEDLIVKATLSDPEYTTLAEGLKYTKHLRRFGVHDVLLKEESARKIGQSLACNKYVTHLSFRKSSLAAPGARAILEGVSELAQSCALNEAINASLEGFSPMATVVGVTSIDLGHNILGDEGAFGVAALLKKSHINSLNLESNQITTEGFKRFFAELPRGIQGTAIRNDKVVAKISLNLVKLNVSGNAPGLEGVKAIADFLAINPTLQSLKLSNCQLGDSSVTMIVNALNGTNLSRITLLDLSNNQIGDSGALNLIKLLKVNHLLVKVNVDNNLMSPENETEIKRLAIYNDQLVAQRTTLPWKSEASVVILAEDSTPVGVTCSTIVSNGLIFIGSSSGEVYVWNPQSDTNDKSRSGTAHHPPQPSQSDLTVDPAYLRQGKLEAKIITYEPESRVSKRRINALVDNLDGTVWCVTDERFITIISINDRAVLKRLPLHKYQAIAISKFGSDIYLGGATGEISLWNSPTQVCRHEIVLDGRFPVNSIHSDGTYIYVGVLVLPARAGHILIFSAVMELLHHFEAHTDIVSSITCLNDRLITASWDDHIKVWKWDAKAANVTLEADLTHHHARVTSCVATSDRLISCSDDNTLLVWDISQHADVKIDKRMLGSWGGSVSSLQTSHNKLVSCSHKEGRVTQWTKD